MRLCLPWGCKMLLKHFPKDVDVGDLVEITMTMTQTTLLRVYEIVELEKRSLTEAERTALGATAVVLLGLVLISATAMHLVEHAAQPDKFGSIPDSMWWAIVTLTTVGYGDKYPVTTEGRLIAALLMTTGVGLFGTFTGFLASWFVEDTAMLVYHYEKNDTAKSNLSLKFCLSGNVYCKQNQQNCSQCL